MHSDPIIVARALEAGATGYVLKDTSSDELMKAFDQVRAGTPYLSNDLAMQVALVRTGVRPNPLADLTPRELQTLSLLAEGKPYGRIAEELNVSYKTVVNACSQLKQKLNAKNLPELIRVAVQLVAANPNSPSLHRRMMRCSKEAGSACRSTPQVCPHGHIATCSSDDWQNVTGRWILNPQS